MVAQLDEPALGVRVVVPHHVAFVIQGDGFEPLRAPIVEIVRGPGHRVVHLLEELAYVGQAPGNEQVDYLVAPQQR